ncbi:hypothetical protein [Corynebacterium uterequi]|uniref:Uncharacterized protein n=1 Tax=Corynebacterium uterequi TaxID=1072256 RepID=A0A0G3HEH7_9CORY|nr:hypothetical protein [Corynebacterium uterequi]AKK11689.1 hypothetical protein CUTER_08535 [Corynebacterium uterequi]
MSTIAILAFTIAYLTITTHPVTWLLLAATLAALARETHAILTNH